jgi:deoxyadenosine/deoxycytidine kinase
VSLSLFGARGNVVIGGQIGQGKTTFMELLAAQLAQHRAVKIWDTENAFARHMCNERPGFGPIDFTQLRMVRRRTRGKVRSVYPSMISARLSCACGT